MTDSRVDWVARESGELVRFVLLWFGFGSVTAPLSTIVAVSTAQRPPLWLGPVAAAALTAAVYWTAERLSWRLVGRTWLLGIVVSVLSIVGFVIVSSDVTSGLGAAVLLSCWWLLSVAVGLALTSPTLWRTFRDRVLLRPRS